MSLSSRSIPSAKITTRPEPQAAQAVRLWLWTVIVLVMAMVVVGGATRLTESGLSITQWQVLTGVLPPLSEDEWQKAFALYQTIPQYKAVNATMDLDGFRTIYLWEWGHRLLGRIIGLAVALPLAFALWRRTLDRRLSWAMGGVLGLVAFQGAVGWWMVRSGLVNRVEVAPERLAAHLLLASLTLASLVWIVTGLRPRPEHLARAPLALRLSGLALWLMVLVQIGLGALVAGSRAGLTYNTWPLMDGRFIPPTDHLLALAPLWRNLFENIPLVQLNHRLGAYVLLALALVHAFHASRHMAGTLTFRRALIVAGLVLVQALAGILTLVLVVPLWAGLLHQALGMVVLIATTRHLRLLHAR